MFALVCRCCEHVSIRKTRGAVGMRKEGPTDGGVHTTRVFTTIWAHVSVDVCRCSERMRVTVIVRLFDVPWCHLLGMDAHDVQSCDPFVNCFNAVPPMFSMNLPAEEFPEALLAVR